MAAQDNANIGVGVYMADEIGIQPPPGTTLKVGGSAMFGTHYMGTVMSIEADGTVIVRQEDEFLSWAPAKLVKYRIQNYDNPLKSRFAHILEDP